jgi:flagellar biosynthesis protein FliR
MVTFTEAQLLGWLTPLLWPFLRTLALLSALPVLGQRSVPTRVRIALAAGVALVAAPSGPAMPVVALDSPEALMLVIQQVLVGFTMGFAVRMVFAAVEMAGELIGLQMGLNFAGFFDPISASQGTATARFLGTMTALLFVVIQGHLLLIAAVAQSFERWPASSQPLAFLAELRPQQWGADIFPLALMVALPVVGLLLFVNVVLGVIARVAPQINVFAVGFPITLSVGLLGLTFSMPLMQAPIQAAVERVISQLT